MVDSEIETPHAAVSPYVGSTHGVLYNVVCIGRSGGRFTDCAIQSHIRLRGRLGRMRINTGASRRPSGGHVVIRGPVA